uniref:Rhodanese-related sulfurtransferase n=1 Tax=uncultured bacterium contig00036 TaxID=1181524 RepID=A0A806KMA5_9BACT|nr:rhodanese-related sulfurtransferase [uncultured bacterium contig00036]
MKTKKLSNLLCLCLFLVLVSTAVARDTDPVVSTEWLQKNLNRSEIAIVDIRAPERYAKEHIPGSINIPTSVLGASRNELTLELPSDDDLVALLGKYGITASRHVVVVTHTETTFSRWEAMRAAWTFILAGVSNASVLDGGITKWMSENKPLSVETPNIRPVAYDGKISRASVASRDYVLANIRKSLITDNRLPEDYFGITSPGHIPGAVSIPGAWLFTSNGALISQTAIRTMAESIFGTDKSKEIITYCGLGAASAAWWFILTQVLDYQNVKVYDGSMEEWLKDQNAPIEAYRWN